MKNSNIIPIEEFDPNSIPDLIKNNDKFYLQTGPIQLTPRGIPQFDKDNNDPDRMYINIPLDSDGKSTIEFKKALMKIDNYFESDDMREKIFGSKANKYVYHPIVRPDLLHEHDSQDSSGLDYLYDLEMDKKILETVWNDDFEENSGNNVI